MDTELKPLSTISPKDIVSAGEKEHTLWYLAAQMSSFGRPALRLMKMDFYDEALIIVRSMGELTNLFALFFSSPESIEEWKQSDHSYRVANLTPGYEKDFS
jgi:hypothetical protein